MTAPSGFARDTFLPLMAGGTFYAVSSTVVPFDALVLFMGAALALVAGAVESRSP